MIRKLRVVDALVNVECEYDLKEAPFFILTLLTINPPIRL